MSEEDVWQMAARHIEKESIRTRARADLKIETVLKHGLEVEKDEPPLRHANIIQWPSSKEERILITLQLAAEAILVVKI